MGERKVLQHHYPPDFDPALLRRIKRDPNQLISVRMASPFGILTCTTCSHRITGGTRFNAKKVSDRFLNPPLFVFPSTQRRYYPSNHQGVRIQETVADESYLGIRVFRLYFKCPGCASVITMKTDPQRADYIVESGAARGYEPWTDAMHRDEVEQRKRAEEDRFQQLERRQREMKTQLDALSALDSIVTQNNDRERWSSQLSGSALVTSVLLTEKRKAPEEDTVPAVEKISRIDDHDVEQEPENNPRPFEPTKKPKKLNELCPVKVVGSLVPYDL